MVNDVFDDYFADLLTGDPLRRVLGAIYRPSPALSYRWSRNVAYRDTDTALHLSIALPGVDPSRVRVLEDNGYLQVEVDQDYLTHVRIPEDIDTAGIEAHSEHGVLTIIMPKVKRPDPRVINVQVGQTPALEAKTEKEPKKIA